MSFFKAEVSPFTVTKVLYEGSGKTMQKGQGMVLPSLLLLDTYHNPQMEQEQNLGIWWSGLQYPSVEKETWTHQYAAY